jgi:predicted MFS family arabinose efflux permease
MAVTFALLLVARALVGVGEAAYAPAAQSVISGAFSARARAKAQAVFAAGMLMGGTAGLALGSVLGTDYGWRSAFYFVGIPGLILGLTVLRLGEPPRPPREEVVPLMQIVRVPAFAAMCWSGTLITFGSISFITWGAKFAEAEKGYSLKEAGVWLGGTLLVAALLGVLVGGAVADYLQRRLVHGRVLTVALAFLAAAPFVLWAIHEERKGWALGSFFIAAFLMSWYHGPVTAVLHDLMPARAHATSVGVYNLVTQFLGGTLAPVVVGRISDLYGLERGLQLAVAVMTLGGLSFLFVIRLIRRHGLQPATPA